MLCQPGNKFTAENLEISTLSIQFHINELLFPLIKTIHYVKIKV